MPKDVIPIEKNRTVRSLLQSEQFKEQMSMVLPKHLTADRMARVACTAVLKTPKLADCKPESLLQALMICSQAGLEPDGRNAHLIPFGDQVQVIFDYKGLVTLAKRNGIGTIYADAVCEQDKFSARVENGQRKIDHVIDYSKPRGEIYAFYAVTYEKGEVDYEVMTRADVDAIRKRSRAGNNGPWVTDYAEMGKKSAIRRMSKRWDLTAEVIEAIANDFDAPNFNQAAVVKPSFANHVMPGDDIPFTETPAATTYAAGQGAPSEPQKEPEKEKKVDRLPELLELMAKDKVVENILLEYLRALTPPAIDDSLTSLAQVNEVSPSAIMATLQSWKIVKSKLSGAK